MGAEPRHRSEAPPHPHLSTAHGLIMKEGGHPQGAPPCRSHLQSVNGSVFHCEVTLLHYLNDFTYKEEP